MNADTVTRRILVVEDEALVALEIEQTLQDAGYDVVGPAGSVDQAFASVAEHGIDAAVLDINLDGEMVWPVAETLRERGVPFVFTTGYADTIQPPRSVQDVPRVDKPIEAERLLSMLSALL